MVSTSAIFAPITTPNRVRSVPKIDAVNASSGISPGNPTTASSAD